MSKLNRRNLPLVVDIPIRSTGKPGMLNITTRRTTNTSILPCSAIQKSCPEQNSVRAYEIRNLKCLELDRYYASIDTPCVLRPQDTESELVDAFIMHTIPRTTRTTNAFINLTVNAFKRSTSNNTQRLCRATSFLDSHRMCRDHSVSPDSDPDQSPDPD